MATRFPKGLKLICAVTSLAGILFGMAEKLFAPAPLLLEESVEYPEFLGWLAWAISALGALAYIAIDSRVPVAELPSQPLPSELGKNISDAPREPAAKGKTTRMRAKKKRKVSSRR